MKYRLFFVFAFIVAICFSQVIPEQIEPPSWNLKITDNLQPFSLPGFDIQALLDEDKANADNKSMPWRFGYEHYVDHSFTDYGVWTTLSNGDKIWRMAYTSDGAITLNFLFDNFKIPEGAKLYVYNNNKTDLLRPFTHHNNNDEEVLGTWLVQGNHAIIEYFEPADVDFPGELRVRSVVHGYRSAGLYQKDLNDSGFCNHDVDCDITPTSDPFIINTKKEAVKKASAMIVIGTGFCSGTLINNTNNDGTPYFLTANHCNGDEPFWAFRFNWRSPNPSCGTFANSPNGSFNQTVSGSTLRARSFQSDMELVQINDTNFFSGNPDLVWAGWNRSTTQVPQIQFGVHHPRGDIQKTCRNDEPAARIITFFGQRMWLVNNWELGVTEPGSSGSGLFNENGHLIGFLSAGNAACSGINDNGGSDTYGRFDVAWDFGSSAMSRLRDWLDPTNTGVTTLELYNPSLSIDEQSIASYHLTIHPNPVKDVLNISLIHDNENIYFELYNAIGQRVLHGQPKGSGLDKTIDLSNQSAGIYFLKLMSDDHFITRKIFKQ